MAFDDYASAVRDEAGGAVLLAVCPRLANLTGEDRWHADPMGHGYDPAVPFSVLAGAGWTVEDVQAFESDWPTVNAGDLAGMLLRSLADLVAYCGLDPAGARAWLQRLYVPRTDRALAMPSDYALRCEARLRQADGLPFGDPRATDFWSWMHEQIRLYVGAAQGDGSVAVHAVDAGLSVEDVLRDTANGTLDWDAVAVLGGLRIGSC